MGNREGCLFSFYERGCAGIGIGGRGFWMRFAKEEMGEVLFYYITGLLGLLCVHGKLVYAREEQSYDKNDMVRRRREMLGIGGWMIGGD